MNKIVTLVLLNGAEVVGRLIEEGADTTTIYKPRLVAPQQNGIAFVPGISMTGVEIKGNYVMPNRSILFMLDTQDQVASAWQQATSGIQLATGNGLVT